MTQQPAENGQSLAPNYDVPENVSPFVPLPILVLCRSCGEATEPLQTYAVAHDGVVRRALCWDCAQRLTPSERSNP